MILPRDSRVHRYYEETGLHEMLTDNSAGLLEVKYLCHRAAAETKNVSRKTSSTKRNQRKIIRKWSFLWAQLKDYFIFANLISLASLAEGEKQLPPECNSECANLDSCAAEVSQAKRQTVFFSWKNNVKQQSSWEKKLFWHSSAVRTILSRTYFKEWSLRNVQCHSV